ncbi:hypothetical protein DK058_26145, partial [Salmonella enterica subsp. enterica serovar Typhi]|nr:hypothetical protein [Salmonella enterica subsp. enterica serovar Typhi]
GIGRRGAQKKRERHDRKKGESFHEADRLGGFVADQSYHNAGEIGTCTAHPRAAALMTGL